jgi:hypothetical protein
VTQGEGPVPQKKEGRKEEKKNQTMKFIVFAFLLLYKIWHKLAVKNQHKCIISRFL